MSENICSNFNLSGINEIICNSLESTPIITNFINKLLENLEQKYTILSNGIEPIIKKYIIKIIIQNVIIQQLPWLMNFWFLIIILWLTKVISFNIFICLFLFSILFTFVMIIIYFQTNLYYFEKLIDDVKLQTKTNLNDLKKSN